MLTGLEDVRLAPTGSEQVLALGWTSGGSAPSVIATPGGSFLSNGPSLPAGRRPLALTALGRGALAVAQVMTGAQAPLVGFTTSATVSPTSWSSETLLTTESNQFMSSVAWAGDAWLVAWNEADQPLVPGVVTRTAELTPAGGLTVTDDLALPSGDYQGLVAGGGRLAGLARNSNNATLQSLQFSGRALLVQQKLAEAPGALGHAALGAQDALQWSDLSTTSYTAQHTVEGNPPRNRSSTGRAGRCAALVGRKFYLPVWNGGALSLLVFDGDDPTGNSSKLVATFGTAGAPACVAANGDLLLLAWSTPNGLVAWRFDTTTGQSSQVTLPGSDSGDQAPVVAPTTGGWVMVWEADSAAGGHGLRANFVSLAGVADNTSSKVGRTTDFEERRPSLAPASTGQVALAWSAFDTASGQTRTLVRVIGEAPVRSDAGVPDAGAEDAGAGDAGSPEEDAGTQPADGGTADAGEDAPDGGEPGAPEPLVLESCGCAAASPPGLLALLALLGLARARSRRR